MHSSTILEFLMASDEDINNKVEVIEALDEAGAFLQDDDLIALNQDIFSESLWEFGYINIQWCILDFAMFVCKDFQIAVQLIVSYSEDELDMDKNLETVKDWWETSISDYGRGSIGSDELEEVIKAVKE